MASNPQTFTERREYQGWAIEYINPPIPVRNCDYCATHPDYEPGHDGHVYGGSISEVMNEIDLYIEEHSL